MTQTVRFVDGVSYSDETIASVFNNIYGTSFVIPTLNLLEVTSSGAADAKIEVDTGMAVALGAVYENTEVVEFTISAQGGGNNRVDRVVLRRGVTAQTVRLTVIEGTPGANPAIPALTSEDMALFWIYVPDGFGAGSTVQSHDIHDERVFGHTSLRHDAENLDNLLANAELLAWVDPTAAVPELWHSGISTGSVAATTPIGSVVPRGQALDLSLNNTEYVEQINAPVPANVHDNSETWITVKGSLQIDSGSSVDVSIEHGAAGTVLLMRRYKITGSVLDVLIRVKLDYSATSYDSIIIRVENVSGGTTALTVNPFILVRGLVPGPYRQKREIVSFLEELTDASWSLTAKSTAVAQIDLSSAFSGYIPEGVRAVIGTAACRDSGSDAAGMPVGLEIQNYYPSATGSAERIELASRANDARDGRQFIVGVPLASHSFAVETWATGAGTLDVQLLLTGIVT